MKKIPIIYDIEVYPNRFGIALWNLKTNKRWFLDKPSKIRNIPFDDERYLFIGFNNFRYDQIVIERFLEGDDPYVVSDNMINKGEEYKPSWNRNVVDLLNQLCPKNAKTALKHFGHRLKYKTLMNLPYPYDKHLTDEEWKHVKEYSLVHDLSITKELWDILDHWYYTKQDLKKHFDCDTHFGNIQRVGEKCILSKLDGAKVCEKMNEDILKTPGVVKGRNDLILNDDLKNLYDELINDGVTILDIHKMNKREVKKTNNGKRYAIKFLDINGIECAVRCGGLHADIPGTYHKVYDYDVYSYYISTLITAKLGSETFRKECGKILRQRKLLQQRNDPAYKGFKLVLNAIYGKLLQVRSQLYNPHIGLSICLLGQFALLDLIEKLDVGQCIYGNTDGLMTKEPIPQEILDEWETRTGYQMKCKEYEILVLNHVNSYYAITKDGKEVRKGDFHEPCWDHNVSAPIIQRAVLHKLLLNESIELTVKASSDPYDFSYFAKVFGENKLELDGKELYDPKIRYFISKTGQVLTRKTYNSGKERISKIRTDALVTLMMNLPDSINEISSNINYYFYIDEAEKLYDKVKTVQKGNLDEIQTIYRRIKYIPRDEWDLEFRMSLVNRG